MESILKSELEGVLLERCAEVLRPLHLRLVDLDCRVGGRSLIRIFIERVAPAEGNPNGGTPESSPGTTLEDCTLASRALSPILEAEPRVPGAFDLEVSSPGLDRRLRLRSDFEVAVGSNVKLKLVESWKGKGANPTGKLTQVGPAELILLVDGVEISIPWDKIKQANRVWSFPSQPR